MQHKTHRHRGGSPPQCRGLPRHRGGTPPNAGGCPVTAAGHPPMRGSGPRRDKAQQDGARNAKQGLKIKTEPSNAARDTPSPQRVTPLCGGRVAPLRGGSPPNEGVGLPPSAAGHPPMWGSGSPVTAAGHPLRDGVAPTPRGSAERQGAARLRAKC